MSQGARPHQTRPDHRLRLPVGIMAAALLAFAADVAIAGGETAARIERLTKELGAGGLTSPGASSSLARIGAPAIPALTKALGDERGLVREWASDALRGMSDDAFRDPRTDTGPVLKALLTALHDDYRNVSFNAARALPHLGALAVPPLIEALSDDVSWVRWRAAYALGRIKPPPVAAVPALTKALGDENSDVRFLSARALGNIGTAAKSAAPALEKLRTDGSKGDREAAAKALAQIAKDQ